MRVKRFVWFLAILALLPGWKAVGAPSAGDFLITAPEQIASYEAHPITVQVPEDGQLTVRVRQMEDETVIWSGEVSQGECSFEWDGLLSYGELLHFGQSAELIAELTGQTGNVQSFRSAFTVVKPACRIQFALPYRDSICAPDPLYQVGIKLSAPGELHFTICPEEEPGKKIVSGIRWVTDPDIVEVVRWRGTLKNGQNAPAGLYRFTCWPDKREDLSVSFPIEVASEKAEAQPLTLTSYWADRVPLSKEERIAFFSSPVPVVDGLEGSGTPVFSEPTYNSLKLGMVHGATVSLKILELGIPNGWTKVGFCRYGDGSYQEGYIRTESLAMVKPSGHYGLIADLASQTMYVFLDGELVGSLLFSSAMDGLKVETCCGVFLTGLRMENFREEGFQYDYVIRIDGSNLLHQVGYRYGQNASFAEQRQQLGTRASHGCIRMAETPGERGTGLTAWWIYSHIPKRTVLIVVDDYAKRLSEAMGETGFTAASPVQDAPDWNE